MKKENFDICVDDDCVGILDWIYSHFKNGNWDKNFQVTVIVREFDYEEDGTKTFKDSQIKG